MVRCINCKNELGFNAFGYWYHVNTGDELCPRMMATPDGKQLCECGHDWLQHEESDFSLLCIEETCSCHDFVPEGLEIEKDE